MGSKTKVSYSYSRASTWLSRYFFETKSALLISKINFFPSAKLKILVSVSWSLVKAGERASRTSKMI